MQASRRLWSQPQHQIQIVRSSLQKVCPYSNENDCMDKMSKFVTLRQGSWTKWIFSWSNLAWSSCDSKEVEAVYAEGFWRTRTHWSCWHLCAILHRHADASKAYQSWLSLKSGTNGTVQVSPVDSNVNWKVYHMPAITWRGFLLELAK